METLFLWVSLLVGLLLSEISGTSSLARHLKAKDHRQQLQPPLTGGHSPTAHGQRKAPADEREQVNTVSVTCHPDSLEIVIKADLFGVGAPVNAEEIRLGVEHSDLCRATASSSQDEYRIFVRLLDCGHKHWMTEDSLIYTNLLIYSPEASPDGVIRMDEAVIPIECHYERKYSLSSSSLTPTWIPFISTQAAVEMLDFNLKLMTPDWLHGRGSNVFYLGDAIGIEASIRVGHHMGLRVFLSSCVATLTPDINSVPRYVFIENGCLIDSQIPDSKSYFLSRTRDDKLLLVIDAFRFNDEDSGELYITCHMTAVPANDAEATNKACTYINGRWRSADGNDYLCGYCQSQNEVDQTQAKPSSSGPFGPRGFRKPVEASWRSGLPHNKVWEQEAKLGPVLVLPAEGKSGLLPVKELPPLLHKVTKTALYGSSWRSGMDHNTDEEEDLSPKELSSLNDLKKGLLFGPAPAEKVELNKDDSPVDQNKNETELKENELATLLENAAPEVLLKTKPDQNPTAGPADASSTAAESDVDVTPQSNATDANSGLSDK